MKECFLKETIRGAIINFFDRLETQLGQLFVIHALGKNKNSEIITFFSLILCFFKGYITVAKSGLSELELQDVLSLDNELLKHFKIKNLIKPKESISRIPWFYVTRLVNALSNHILIKPFQGINTICWRHDIFNQVVNEKYLSKFFNES